MMRNPRRLSKTPVDVGLIESVAPRGVVLPPKTRPPDDSLFWRMWEASEHQAQEALKSDFVRAIENGTLDPVTYGSFIVADAWYCFRGPDIYDEVAKSAKDPTLQCFLREKQKSYKRYNQWFTETWRLRDAGSIEPTNVLYQYADFEERVAREKTPIYTLVAMLPCERLWGWLGSQLSPPNVDNLYASWINDNNDLSGGYQIGNYLEYFAKKHPGAIDEEEAFKIYREAMRYEVENFKSATSSI